MMGGLEEILKDLSDDGKLGGVYLAVPTGETLEDDPTMIEVIIYDKSFFAKPCMAFGSYNVPNKEWLEKYKDEVLVWVAFENGNSAHPVYLGVHPKDGKVPEGNYPNIKTWKSVEFTYTFDDTAKKFRIEHVDGSFFEIDGENGQVECKSKDGQGYKANTNTILGGGNGKQQATLGNKNAEALMELSNKLDALYNAIAGATTVPQDGGVSFKATLLSALSGQFPTAPTMNIKSQDTLSKKVKLD